ncbi:MAG: glycine cleavage system protein GcvH [Acidimicrobiales bacterium]|nr:glycine cleavage system protein GcvH [Acidimicrobiales bacterium]MCB1250272.1 glycine cleavage system protein GcvH [Acidimicrobiales bacterium]MCB1258850.1 glycine cleavage system protein GcvH [Acidimicrobiales bacterium]
MEIPADLRYATDHEWARVTDGTARIGITDYAQDALGDVVYLEIPEVGASVTASDKISEVESTKSVSDIYAPLSGTITAVNPALEEQPELVNSDPYGEGWICEIELSDASEVDGLLDADGYRALTES